MQFKIQVIVDDEHGEAITEDVFILDKSTDGESLVDLRLTQVTSIQGGLDHRLNWRHAHSSE